ncbi:hypothetical protein BUALT_Bualt01G0078100 [Buddleja alternifolia]|uniref:J domain-containing protein n=1 Tax=Buddleja alternifolia TaxID=168488 RepID=A0AAV6YBA6_9LAMI|nr:hypothetical protein BUALT_Bualt01G0078100 [Buddleja alternifolia]
MEYCNKDEALRAKSIAEDKIHKRDFISARKFALKAKNLCPGLDGISQMLTTIDVYASADQNKIRGEVDWYGVLGLNPSVDDDDDEEIKKQYRKLALMLHPDKNKSVGAHGAFVLISEAFGILSDKAKRLAYKKRRGLIRVSQGSRDSAIKLQNIEYPSLSPVACVIFVISYSPRTFYDAFDK